MKKAFLLFSAACMACCARATGPLLVGMTGQGGVHNTGSIIRYTGGATSVAAHYDLPVGGPVGSNSSGSLIEASTGNMYGMTSADGTHACGTLFEYVYPTNTYIVRVNFDSITDGAFPFGSLLQASNGTLYGMTSRGGSAHSGILFSYTPGASAITVLFNFPANACPTGSLIQSANGNLYGMTQDDGANSGGTIFEYSIAANTCTVMHNLPAAASPRGSLLEVSGLYYGLTNTDGNDYGGSLFSYDLSTDNYINLYSFYIGAQPSGSPILANDGKLYGTLSGYGNGSGFLFSYDIIANNLSMFYYFGNLLQGTNPHGSLYQASDGMLYGMTWLGGSSYSGGIFKYNITTATYTFESSLTTVTGDQPNFGNFTEYIPPVNCTPSVSVTSTGTSPCSPDTFTATAANYGWNPVYQWYRNNAPVGTNSASYTAQTLNNNDSVFVRLTATPCGTVAASAVSNKIKITGAPGTPASVTISANNTNLNLGGPITLTAVPLNGGTNDIYTWYHNGAVIASADNAVLTYGGALGNGDRIYCTITSSTCGTAQTAASNTITFTMTGSGAKEITGFVMSNQIGTSVINSGAATITAVVPLLPAARTAIHPLHIYISALASYGPSEGINQNFSLPVTYVVRAQDGTTKVWTVTVTDAAGQRLAGDDAADALKEGLTLYPNPASASITALMQGGAEPAVVTIVDLTGRVMYNQQLPASDVINHLIDVSPFASGVYILHIAEGDRVEIKQFVVDKR